MLRPRQARSLAGQNFVMLNKFLQIHAAENTQGEALTSTPHHPMTISANTMAIFGNPRPTPALFPTAQ
jgi:hypothetical protein